LTWDWHRFGLLVTPTTVTSYFDDKPMGSQPMPQYADKSAPLWGWMMNLAMGSGWPVNAPPANHHVDQRDSAVSLIGVSSSQAT